MSNSQEPPFIPLPVPPEYSVQWPPPSEQISKPIRVPDPAPVPVPKHPIDLPPGDPKIDSQSLPVPLECTEQCQAPSVPNGEQSQNPTPLPDPALVPVPEHAPDLHSRGPSSDSSNHSGSSLKGYLKYTPHPSSNINSTPIYCSPQTLTQDGQHPSIISNNITCHHIQHCSVALHHNLFDHHHTKIKRNPSENND
ncbi:CREB-regulated transcription coactivator 1-like [Macrobrachium rosenbergii]|uniref:CREB-regulated transcription coactivator 1-like n=1 Tax=Macrobrachium rosenbergii TaxID=79674 RepID=UPI0034D75C6D